MEQSDREALRLNTGLLLRMPMDRLAVLAAVQTSKHVHNNGSSPFEADAGRQGSNMSNNGRAGRFDNDVDGNVHVFLGGAMMSGVIIVVVLMCYCCHRKIRKHRPQEYSHYCPAESDINSLEVFTTYAMRHGDQSAGLNHEEETISVPCPSTLGSPPTYDSLIFNPQSLPSPNDKNNQSLIPGETPDFTKTTESAETTKEIPIFKDNEGLPSYEVALKLEANGYV